MISSCDLFKKDETFVENSKGPNFVTFEKSNIIYSQVATGDEYTFEVEIKVAGPTVADLTADVPVTIEIDPTSTAIAGTHYRFDNNTLTLKANNNYLGKFYGTMITDGIVAPLPADPKIIFKAKVNGVDGVVASGKPVTVNLVYGCLSHFEGTYDVTTQYTAYDGSVSTLTWTEDITKTGVEEYRTTRVGHWTPAQLGGTPGFTFFNKCDDLSVPGQNLVDLYGNWVSGNGSANATSDTLTFNYTICYPKGSDHCRSYSCEFVKQ